MASVKDAIRFNNEVQKRKNKKHPAHQGSFISKILESDRVEMQYGNADKANHTGVINKFQIGYFKMKNRMY